MTTSTRPQAVPTQQLSNEHFIVTEWRFAPGAETGWHTHGHNYVVVPQTNGELLLETPEGLITAPLVAKGMELLGTPAPQFVGYCLAACRGTSAVAPSSYTPTLSTPSPSQSPETGLSPAWPS